MTIIWLILTAAFIASRNIKVKQLVMIFVLHVGLTLAAYNLYAGYKKTYNEYVAYAYEQYAIDNYLDRFGQPDSWPYRIDPEAEKLEDRQDKYWLLFLGVATLDILVLLYVGTSFKKRYQ
jgi:hypothetical protein